MKRLIQLRHRYFATFMWRQRLFIWKSYWCVKKMIPKSTPLLKVTILF
jgi:hypothetical protein